MRYEIQIGYIAIFSIISTFGIIYSYYRKKGYDKKNNDNIKGIDKMNRDKERLN